MISPREIAYKILLKFWQDKTRLNDLLTQFLSQQNMDGRDRRFLRNLVSGSVRHLLYLDWIAARLYKGKYGKMLDKTKTVLRLALFEIIFMDAVPERASITEYVNLAKRKTGQKTANTINGILRSYLRQAPDLNPGKIIKDPVLRISTVHSFPQWMVQRWNGFWGAEETEALCASLNQPPRFDLRVNQAIISIAKFKTLLDEHDISYAPSSFFPDMFMVEDLHEIIEKGWLAEGLCSVQDESAAIPVRVLNPGTNDKVLDVCAAPGGKYQQILQEQPALAVAMDADLDRLKRVRENVERLKLKGAQFVCADGNQLPFKPVFTKILLDAPCSGLGVIRKHPDIKWRRDFSEIVEFSKLQQGILDHSVQALRAGGSLLYSTCTMDQLENENIVQSFLQNSQGVVAMKSLPDQFDKLVDNGHIRTYPHKHDTDGSFCALLQKKSG